MTNGDLWDMIHTILKKESKGNILKPDRFTDLLQQCHLEYYNQQYEKWAVSQTSLDSMRPFVMIDQSVTFSSGTASLSSTPFDSKPYQHLIAARTSSGGVDILSAKEVNEWTGDAVMAPSTSYPVMTVDGSNLHIYPNTITAVTVSYLKTADSDPVFDYYIDSNYTVQYLTNGETHTLTTGETGSGGESAPTEVTGASVELEWGDNDKINIISLILEKLGVSLQAPDITQYAMALEQKQNVA